METAKSQPTACIVSTATVSGEPEPLKTTGNQRKAEEKGNLGSTWPRFSTRPCLISKKMNNMTFKKSTDIDKVPDLIFYAYISIRICSEGFAPLLNPQEVSQAWQWINSPGWQERSPEWREACPCCSPPFSPAQAEFTGRCYDYLLSCAPLNLIASTKVNSAFSFVLHYELEFDMAEQIPVFPHTLYVSYPDFPSRQILGARKSIFKLRPCSWHPPSSGTKVNLIPETVSRKAVPDWDVLELVSGRDSSGCDILSIWSPVYLSRLIFYPVPTVLPRSLCPHFIKQPPLLDPPQAVTTSLFQERS
ncbi:hypothetical protein MJG53_014214 [Ovis ammon polii x Ovis aries]|uniref:Uncharacterized protein n=1 Tax=Ovis ammon polii x Ovis aries TaxID=2918886 RepID=A0ACB9UGH8_9CETA|nr:hypothetical protein MJG53_014214 [Ovis ammon polii x Ovis aries]